MRNFYLTIDFTTETNEAPYSAPSLVFSKSTQQHIQTPNHSTSHLSFVLSLNYRWWPVPPKQNAPRTRQRRRCCTVSNKQTALQCTHADGGGLCTEILAEFTELCAELVLHKSSHLRHDLHVLEVYVVSAVVLLQYPSHYYCLQKKHCFNTPWVCKQRH